MRFSLSAIALVAAAQVAQADFYIYRAMWSQLGKDAPHWQFHSGVPSCDTVFATPIWTDSSDVSGSKLGVRCKGSGCVHDGPIRNIEQLEFHTSNSPLLHFTIYASGYNMIGLDGKTYGTCTQAPFGDWNNCWWATLLSEGRRKFHCKAPWSAAQMNRAAREATDATSFREILEATSENGTAIAEAKTAVAFKG